MLIEEYSILGSVSEDFCGVEPVTHLPEPLEIKPFPNVHVAVDNNALKIVASKLKVSYSRPFSNL